MLADLIEYQMLTGPSSHPLSPSLQVPTRDKLKRDVKVATLGATANAADGKTPKK
jgi:hypothetical protein